MRKEFAKWEIKTSVFSGRKPQAGNYCAQNEYGTISELGVKLHKAVDYEERFTRRTPGRKTDSIRLCPERIAWPQ
jgi:hypothetical protein